MGNIDFYLSRLAKDCEISDYYDLYSFIPNVDLQKILASFHAQLNHWFAVINSDLRTTYDEEGNKIYCGGYFHAQDSRDLLQLFDRLDHLKAKLNSTNYNFMLTNDAYEKAIRYCKKFVVSSGGSTIPEGFMPIEIEDVDPIFQLKSSVKIDYNKQTIYSGLKCIGEGSYAQVFTYTDPIYHFKVALKRAKPELDDKELDRFKQEFTVLKSLHSPYVIQVYAYNEENNEYSMEYMDESIYKYIYRCNSRLTLRERKSIITQIARGFRYIHSKGYLHRDISLTNILVKHYEDVDIFKIGDFGLVKNPANTLTSVGSEIKGSLNDPDLINVGFSNYEMCHETFALTRLCFYILTGRTTVSRQRDGMIKQFWNKGTSTKKEERFKDVTELLSFVKQITEENL